MSAPQPIILILGPTAGGKTRLAIDLADALPGGGECVSADSMQVYRGMDIGTAKPTTGERAEAPHHLLDVADPADDGFSVDTWLHLADSAIGAIRARGRHPIVVGGTNLYVQALLSGLVDGPAPDPDLRERLREMDAEHRRAWLERVDPDAARMIHPHDVKRTIRAIEVHERTGRPMSETQGGWESGRVRTDVRIVGLVWPVEAINRRINARVRAMADAGLVEEVRALHEAGALGPQAREALGYKQVIEHLEGRCSLEEAIEQIRIRSRRFAKQQRTWLRRFRRYPGTIWVETAGLAPQELATKVLTLLDATPPIAAQSPSSVASEGIDREERA
ncbi:MAG: tRNA (adenosine(37)-N6)-dimethylallyltransferase MiaA [Planctomycetes bacterium]|nr:tRNA (adenosine(37)-N6)-dimethylallyltransferase MiaA [Planctomycetota bacterium]